jgi:hypothetical protein
MAFRIARELVFDQRVSPECRIRAERRCEGPDRTPLAGNAVKGNDFVGRCRASTDTVQ